MSTLEGAYHSSIYVTIKKMSILNNLQKWNKQFEIILRRIMNVYGRKISPCVGIRTVLF